jgi:hypothetical protein
MPDAISALARSCAERVGTAGLGLPASRATRTMQLRQFAPGLFTACWSDLDNAMKSGAPVLRICRVARASQSFKQFRGENLLIADLGNYTYRASRSVRLITADAYVRA